MTLHQRVTGKPKTTVRTTLSDIFTDYNFAEDPYPEGRGIYPRTGWAPSPNTAQDVWRSQRLVSEEMFASLDATAHAELLGTIEDQALIDYRRRTGNHRGEVTVRTTIHEDPINPLSGHKIYTTTIRPREWR